MKTKKWQDPLSPCPSDNLRKVAIIVIFKNMLDLILWIRRHLKKPHSNYIYVLNLIAIKNTHNLTIDTV